MSLYFQSIGLSLAPKSLESGNLTKLSLLPININFQLLIPVLGNKDEQLNKHLGEHPLASPQTHPSPFWVPSPLAACGPCGEMMGVGTLQLTFLCCSSFLTLWLPVSCNLLRMYLLLCHGLHSHPARVVHLGWLSLPPYPFLAWSVGWWWWSVCVTLLFLLLAFFNQS